MSADAYISSGVLELYVAGVLTPDEKQKVEEMAATHPEVRREIENLERVLMTYAEHKAPEMPARMEQKIWQAIKAQPAEPQEEVKEETAKEHKPRTQRVGADNRKFWIAAAVVLLFISASLNAYLYVSLLEMEDRMQAVESEKRVLEENVNAALASNQDIQERLKVYDNPDYKMAMLKPLPDMPVSEAVVYWNPLNKGVYLKINRLPEPPAGKQYQLWAIDREGNPVDAGMVKQAGRGALLEMKQVSDATGFAITLEPLGGSKDPTLDAMYVKGEV